MHEVMRDSKKLLLESLDEEILATYEDIKHLDSCHITDKTALKQRRRHVIRLELMRQLHDLIQEQALPPL